MDNYNDALKYDYVIAYDTSVKSTKKYIGFETKNEAIVFMNNSKSNNFYELLKSDDVLMYFDKDNIKMTDEIFNEYYDKLCSYIPRFFEELKDKDINKYEANVKDNKLCRDTFDFYTKRDKDGLIISIHFISNEYYTTKEDNKKLCLELNKLDMDFDTSVYSKKRLFCLNNNCKFGKSIKFEYDKLNYSEYECDKFVSWFDKDDYTNIKLMFEEEPIIIEEQEQEKTETIIFNKNEIIEYLKKSNNKLWSSTLLWKVVMRYIKYNNLMNKEEFCELSIQMNTNKRKKYTIDKNISIWDLTRGKASDDYIINILNKSNNEVLYVNKSNVKITNDEWNFINKFYILNDEFKENINQQITKQLKIKKTKYTYNYNGLKVNIKNGIVSYKDVFTNIFLESDNRKQFDNDKMIFDEEYETREEIVEAVYNNNLNEDNNLILLNGKWGSGKTATLDKIIEEKKTGIVCLSENNPLNGQLKKRLSRNGVNFISHLDFKNFGLTKTSKHQNYVISMESVYLIDELDYLILDEVVSILHHFNSNKTMDKHSKNDIKSEETPLLNKYMMIVDIVNKAKKVYCMDADITEEIKLIIEKLFKIPPKTKSFNLLFHNYNEYKFNYYNDKNMIENQINKDISKNIIIVCNRADYARTYEKMYKKKVSSLLKITKDDLAYYENGVLKINLNTDREVDDFVYNINENIENLRPQFLIYSPKLSTGISIDVIHYDKLFCVADNNSVSARSLIQMLFRVRDLKSKEMNFYLLGAIHRPINKFNFNYVSNILADTKHQVDKYNEETIKILVDFKDVSSVKEDQNHNDYDNDLKQLDDNYIELRTYNLMEKLKTSNLFIQDFFNIFCINHNFHFDYIGLKEDFESDFKEKKDAGKYDKAKIYQTTDLITPNKYVEIKELMKTEEWEDKTSYEKSKMEKEVEKFNDLVKININTSSYSSYGLYQYDILVDVYDRLNNNVDWIHNFITERKDIVDKQSRYFKNNIMMCKDHTSEKINLNLQFKHTDDLMKQFDLIIGCNCKKKVNEFNKVIIENLDWYNRNFLTKYNKSNKKIIEKFKDTNTKEVFKLIVNELKPFYDIYKSFNGKYIYIDTYKFISYSDKKLKENKPKLKEFNRITPYKPNNYIMETPTHKQKQIASQEWLKNIVGLVKHNLQQEKIIGHTEQLVSKEHNEKIQIKQKGRKQYNNKFNNSKLFLQDNKNYKEYKTHINTKLSALKYRKSQDTNKEIYIIKIQKELYDYLYKININEDANNVKININDCDNCDYTIVMYREYKNDEEFMGKYWVKYYLRKIEEWKRVNDKELYDIINFNIEKLTKEANKLKVKSMEK